MVRSNLRFPNTRRSSEAPDPQKAAAKIRKMSSSQPALAIVLGSGFHHFVDRLEVDAEIRYADLPGFPPVGVAGHAGRLLIGRTGAVPLIVLSGRAHFYEGYSMTRVAFGVRVLAACGIRDIVLTNAAGGINRSFKAGDFMVIRDHINLMGTNPLRSAPALDCVSGIELPRFVDLSRAYDPALGKMLIRAGRECGLKMREGVYLAVSGPSYETPAEIRAFSRLGADAVGMSTVPEAIVARQHGMRVAGLSCITNLAAGRSAEPLSHNEVLAVADRVKTMAAQMLARFASLYGRTR